MSGVDTLADLQAKGSQCIADRPRALHRARGTIERREEAVTGVVDLAAAKPVELFAHDRVVLLEQVAPPRIPSEEASSVDRTMSVNRTVHRTRSISGTGRTPVMNSWISSSTPGSLLNHG